MTRLCLCLCATFWFSPGTSPAAPIDWNAVHSLTMRGIDRLYNMDIVHAETIFDSVCIAAPGDPRGYFFRGMVSFWLYTLTRDEQRYERFLTQADSVIDVCEEVLDRDEKNGAAHFFLGGIYGYRGLALQAHGSLLKAVYDGRKGYSHLLDAIESDTSLYDAHMGLGLFRYYATRAPKSVSWILRMVGLTGDAAVALRELRLAADKGLYARTEATYFLSQFMVNEKRDDEALAYARVLVERFPENPLFLLNEANIWRRAGNFDAALNAVQRARDINDRRSSPYGDEFINSTLAAIQFVKNDFPGARKNFAAYLAKSKNPFFVNNSILYRYGIATEIAGDRQEALQIYRRATPPADDAHNYGQLFFKRCQERITHPLGREEILLLEAGNDLARKSFDSALELYDTVLVLQGAAAESRAQAWYGIQNSQFERKHYEESLAAGETLRSLTVTRELWLHPYSWFKSGQAFAKLNKTSEAKKALQQARRFNDYDGKESIDAMIEDEMAKL